MVEEAGQVLEAHVLTSLVQSGMSYLINTPQSFDESLLSGPAYLHW